jgi:ribose/xylose/arabinose/galactoside ABC-type transport system permease subunit
LISSELPEVLAHADRIVVFREGRVSAEFTRDEATAEAVASAALPAAENDPSRDDRPARRLARSPLAWTELSLAVAILILGFSLQNSTGRFLTHENIVGVLASASVWTILALGASVVILSGGIDVSIGSLLALAAGSGGLIMTRVGDPVFGVPLGIAAALVVGALGGLTNAAAALAGGVHPIVVTLGTMTIFRGLLILLTGGDSIFDLPASFTRLATANVLGVSGSVWIMAAATAAAALWLGWTPSGRKLYALGASPRAAWLVGVSQRKGWLTAFAVGGLLAGLAGLLELALTGSMQSRLGTGYELRAIAAAVIGGTAVTGGRGSPMGVALGALLLSMIQNALVLWETSPFHYDLVLGGLLVGAVALDWLLRRFA